MRFFKLISVAAALVLSAGANAELISYNGYTLNTDTNIVTGGGLEWLQWTETEGMSVNDALSTHNGWRIATSTDVTNLINSFNFGLTSTYDPMEPAFSEITNSSALVNFMELFGARPDQFFELSTAVLFGGSIDGSFSSIILGYNDELGDNALVAFPDSHNADSSGGLRGLALVKVSAVPVPAAVWLFGSGLLGLIGVARRKTLCK